MSYQYPYSQGHSSSVPATPSYHWEDDQLHQHQQQHQHQHQHQHQQQQHIVLDHEIPSHQTDQQSVYATSPTTVIELPELLPIVPSQNPVRSRPGSSFERDHQELRLQHVASTSQSQPYHLRLDTHGLSVATSASPPSGPSSADASGAYRHATGPIRVSPSQIIGHRDAVHPYMRAQSVTLPNVGTSKPKPKARPKPKPRVEEEESSVRFGEPSTSSVPKPTPASTPRESTAPAFPNPNPAMLARLMTTTKGLINTAYSGYGPNPGALIRTDVHFDPETKILTAMCELPGRTKSDVTIVLATNPFTGSKQLTITAKSTPMAGLADREYLVRERKEMIMSRILMVPLQTKPGDINVSMKDGLLIIAIQCPTPILADTSEEIEIR